MLGMQLPDVDVWSERVAVALGQNPSLFTGPGTNTYLIGTGPETILLDPGQGLPSYLPVLERAMERAGCRALQEIVLTHGHADHIGGVRSVLERFGPAARLEVPVAGGRRRARPRAHAARRRRGRAHRGRDAARRPHAGARARPPVLRARGGARPLLRRQRARRRHHRDPEHERRPRRLPALAGEAPGGAAGAHLPRARARDRGRRREAPRVHRAPARARAPDPGRARSEAPPR